MRAPASSIAHAVAALRQGQIIAYPTETLFGLGADPFHPHALTTLLQLKGRTTTKGLILLIATMEHLAMVAAPPSRLACRLMGVFWPGPLTLVLPAAPGLSPLLTGDTGYVAVRFSPAPRVAALLRAWDNPLVSTSANRSGEQPACDAATIRQLWPTEVAAIIPGRCQPTAKASTVVRVTADNTLTLLRAGLLPFAHIQAAAAG
ncbi:MAG: threonylcarbamoyl-AMP synthase [Magnetococcales bacterium]|nr:threonylcarbamoyl-AMP synthase [Magnetococcales bacterium]